MKKKAHQKPTNCRRIFRRAATEININNSNKKSFGLRVKHLRLEKKLTLPRHTRFISTRSACGALGIVYKSMTICPIYRFRLAKGDDADPYAVKAFLISDAGFRRDFPRKMRSKVPSHGPKAGLNTIN